MRTICILFISFFYSAGVFAQQNTGCIFERLFNLTAGLSKEMVKDSLSSMHGFTLVNTMLQTKTDANAQKAGSKEILVYRIDAAQCFNGANSKLQLEFAEGKLNKASIQTEFARTDYYDMLDNFTVLRNKLKTSWEREKEIKATSGNLVSSGFDYSKAKQPIQKTDKISLQYIHTKPGQGYGIYLLQLSWINTTGAAIETISY